MGAFLNSERYSTAQSEVDWIHGCRTRNTEEPEMKRANQKLHVDFLLFRESLFLTPMLFKSQIYRCVSVQFSCSVVSNSLQLHGLQQARLPCPSPTPGAYSNSCPSSRWCHPTISSSVDILSSCLQSVCVCVCVCVCVFIYFFPSSLLAMLPWINLFYSLLKGAFWKDGHNHIKHTFISHYARATEI